MEAKPKKSRRKPVLEPIRLDEILTGPGMSGFLSVLEPPVKAPHLQRLVNEIKDIPLAELSEAQVQAPPAETIPVESSGLESSGARRHQDVSSGVDSLPLETRGGPWSGIYPPLDTSPGGRRLKIREAQIAADGHSLGEQALYEALYRAAHPYSEQARIITVGLDRMAEMARMAYRNCKLNCRALVEKLALEEVRTYSYTRGRTYLVYHAEEVVRRRRAAGLTHVIKTRGVVFVDPETGAERTQKRHVKTTPLVSSRAESLPLA